MQRRNPGRDTGCKRASLSGSTCIFISLVSFFSEKTRMQTHMSCLTTGIGVQAHYYCAPCPVPGPLGRLRGTLSHLSCNCRPFAPHLLPDVVIIIDGFFWPFQNRSIADPDGKKHSFLLFRACSILKNHPDASAPLRGWLKIGKSGPSATGRLAP